MRSKNSSAWLVAENHESPLDGVELQQVFKKEGKLKELPTGRSSRRWQGKLNLGFKIKVH